MVFGVLSYISLNRLNRSLSGVKSVLAVILSQVSSHVWLSFPSVGRLGDLDRVPERVSVQSSIVQHKQVLQLLL